MGFLQMEEPKVFLSYFLNATRFLSELFYFKSETRSQNLAFSAEDRIDFLFRFGCMFGHDSTP